jgi:hypothetical protein
MTLMHMSTCIYFSMFIIIHVYTIIYQAIINIYKNVPKYLEACHSKKHTPVLINIKEQSLRVKARPRNCVFRSKTGFFGRCQGSSVGKGFD